MAAPWWKKMFDVAEGQVGPILGQVMANPDVLEATTLAMAVQKRASDDIARAVQRGLHAINVPAGTDVQKVSQQIAALERELRLLNRRLDDLRVIDVDIVKEDS